MEEEDERDKRETKEMRVKMCARQGGSRMEEGERREEGMKQKRAKFQEKLYSQDQE